MKTILSARRFALLGLALGTASVTASFAQTSTPTTTTTPAPTCTAGGHHHHDSILNADEKAQLRKDRDAAFASDPSLQTDHNNLKQQFETLKGQGSVATKDQWQALHQQKHEFEAKLHAAELKIDPTLAPIFAKLEAAHQNGHHSST